MSKFKRLYLDLEVSPNIMFSWTAGYKLNLSYENIIKERAIMCVCWKWEGEKKVYSLEWNKGDDKKLLQDFIKIMNQADEVIGHNQDNFDLKWIKTRCLFHKIPTQPTYNSVDTYKLAKRYFRFNSNKLDYISDFLGYGKKIHTGFDLWKDILLKNSESAMKKMIAYCRKDVELLEKVHQSMKAHVKEKTHIAIVEGGKRSDCPTCGSTHTVKSKTSVTAAGYKRQQYRCKDCGHYHSI